MLAASERGQRASFKVEKKKAFNRLSSLVRGAPRASGERNDLDVRLYFVSVGPRGRCHQRIEHIVEARKGQGFLQYSSRAAVDEGQFPKAKRPRNKNDSCTRMFRQNVATCCHTIESGHQVIHHDNVGFVTFVSTNCFQARSYDFDYLMI